MRIAERVGLVSAASEFVVGLNGDEESIERTKKILPKCEVLDHGVSARSELPTLRALQLRLRDGEHVLYFHSKGVTHPHNELCETWSRCMENAVIRNWRQCVNDLDAGCETVGAHWLTREEFGPMVDTFFWGGNFFWSKSEFLKTLPELPETSTCREQDFLAEMWIGRGKRPIVKDYAHHWPGLEPCSRWKKNCFLIS